MSDPSISRFKNLQMLAGGTTGIVYLADDTELGRKVTLKLFPPQPGTDEEASARFAREAIAASELNHPNVCTIYEIGRTGDGQQFMTMARYEGRTLKERLDSGRLPAAEAIEIVRQIAEGLGSAHKEGIIHGAISPASIFITGEGSAVLMDFGLAVLTGGPYAARAGGALDALNYQSPEQLRGEEVDHRTDIWSLGVVLYEMLAGRKPFEAEHARAVRHAVLTSEPRSIPQVSAFVEGIVRSCLNKPPGERTASAGTLASRLAQASASL